MKPQSTQGISAYASPLGRVEFTQISYDGDRPVINADDSHIVRLSGRSERLRGVAMQGPLVIIEKGNLSTQAVPIIILSAVSTSDDRIRLLEAGADDFIAKPCGVEEVITRARAVLRRNEWRSEPPGGREATHGEYYDPHRG